MGFTRCDFFITSNLYRRINTKSRKNKRKKKKWSKENEKRSKERILF